MAWLGREWQDYCIQLLQVRYGRLGTHALQLVPDKDKGDLGLEAFSHDGVGYQCYAAEEPLTVGQCVDKQKSKLTRDLGKLRNKAAEVAELLGPVVIHRYVFMVHRHDSRQLIPHAHKKAADVRAWELSFITDGFSIVIETDDDYANEKRELHAVPAPVLEPSPLTHDEVTKWSKDNSELRSIAARKLEVAVASRGTVDSVINGLLNQYLLGENGLEKLKATSPDGYSRVLSARSRKEELLVLEYPDLSSDGQRGLASIARELESELVHAYPALPSSMARTLAWAAVADWLMRCPLDFGEPA